MSHDVCVWYPTKRLSPPEASKLFINLIEGNTSVVSAHPSIDAFYKELTAKHPEFGKGSDDDCPWAIEFERSQGHIMMSVIWSRAEEIFELICELANSHGLAVIETERETPIYPSTAVGKKSVKKSKRKTTKRAAKVPRAAAKGKRSASAKGKTKPKGRGTRKGRAG